MSDRTTERGDAPETFRAYLQRRKREGTLLLLTGRLDAEARAHASRRFFGESGAEDAERRRLLICTDSGVTPSAYLPGDVSPDDDDVRVLHESVVTRRAAAASGDCGDVDDLYHEASDALSALLAGTEAAPGVLRVGITSLAPLLREAGPRRVHAFCRRLGERVRDEQGMAHAHLPVSDDDRRVDELDPVADARVELRRRSDGRIENRWHLPYPELDDRMRWVDL